MYLPTIGFCLLGTVHSIAAMIDFECELVEVDVLTATNTPVPSHVCVHNHIAYDVSLSGLADDVKLGDNILLTKVTLDTMNSRVTLSKHSKVKAVNQSLRRRNLATTTGRRDVLVVRVDYGGKSPQLSVEELAGRIFGTGNKQVGLSVVEQYRACSFGKLEMEPFKAQGVVAGVARVSITTAVSGPNSVLSLQNLVINKVKTLWQIDQLDHLILVMPDAGLQYYGSSFLAYAFINGQVSVYNNLWGGRLSGVMHETGHNLGLHHSGQGGNEYGDQSGYMGYGSVAVGGPAMCFNGQKNWQLGWYADRSLRLDYLDLPWSGSLSTFVDYNSTKEGDFVVLQLGGRRNSNSLFLQFNKNKDFNVGTIEFPNRVTIVEADMSQPYPKSNFLSALAPDRSGIFRFKNFEKSGFDLIIRGCQKLNGKPEGVRISAYLDGHSDTCMDKLVLPRRCEDTNSTLFFVDETQGLKTCSWLEQMALTSNHWPEVLCKPGHLAYQYCQGTCRTDC